MKFGTEFNSRSVLRWKNYNIDYNLLKNLIREATTGFDETSSSSSCPTSSESDDTTDSKNSLNSHQKKLLKNLYKNFQDQIDFVSLFVFSKVGEISRRLSALKRQCNIFIESESSHPVSDITLRIRKRKLMALHKELDLITTELKDLSRFLLLQKIAVKKLFKKFLKYSSYSKKQAFIDRINEKCLQQNSKSFIHLTLDDLTLETTLLYDFLDTYLHQDAKKIEASKFKRNPSIHTIDSLTSTTESYNKNSPSSQEEEENEKSHFSRTTTFDIVSKRKGPKSMIFWVHKDNLDELKFLLSSEFKLITDDSPFSKNTLLKNTRSTFNLKENQENVSSNVPTPVSNQSPKFSKDDFTPETQTVSVWLNNPDCFNFVKSTDFSNINYTPKTTQNLHYYKANPYAQILVSNLNSSQNKNKEDINPILITPIGGLRQFSIATLDKSLVDELFDDSTSNIDKDEKKSKSFNEWKERKLHGNSQMTQSSLNFTVDENLKPLASISSSKLRFINLDESDKINCYISLDWDIKIMKSDLNSASSEIETFPYAILELNYELPESELPEKISNIIDSYLVYRVDHLNFSLNNFLVYSFINQFDSFSVSDDEMLLFIAPWHQVLNKDIRSLPEIRSKSIQKVNPDTNSPSLTPQEGILLNKNDEICKKPGYWNEFDNGSDYGDDSEGFYVYENDGHGSNSFTNWFTNLFLGKQNETVQPNDIESNASSFSNNSGLEWISPENTNKLLKLTEKMSKMGDKSKKTIFQLNDPDIGLDENLSLLRRNNNNNNNNSNNNDGLNYGSINDETGYADTENDESDSDTEAILSSLPQHGRGSISRSDSYITKENHDKCLSFLYLTMIVCSTLTSSIGAFIIKAIFASNTFFQPQLTAGIIVLITFAIFCSTLSLILTGFSISLLIFRFTKAPIWHFLVVWSCALISTTFFFYGLTTCI